MWSNRQQMRWRSTRWDVFFLFWSMFWLGSVVHVYKKVSLWKQRGHYSVRTGAFKKEGKHPLCVGNGRTTDQKTSLVVYGCDDEYYLSESEQSCPSPLPHPKKKESTWVSSCNSNDINLIIHYYKIPFIWTVMVQDLFAIKLCSLIDFQRNYQWYDRSSMSMFFVHHVGLSVVLTDQRNDDWVQFGLLFFSLRLCYDLLYRLEL